MIVIIGAGLSGLLTGYLLKKEGIPFKILEARNRVGGRINTLYRKDEAPVEMGATWFTKEHTNLMGLLEELKLGYFAQVMTESVFYQATATTPTQLVQIPADGSSYRISGGTSKLINTLVDKLDSRDILFNKSVKQIRFLDDDVEAKVAELFTGSSIVLAIPPKLWANNISFEPALPNDLIKVARQTQTWMEDSIKAALTFKEPFWEQQRIPATLFSNAGPVAELYDHCDLERSNFGLCGFIHSSFKNLSFAERKEKVLIQLKNIFGASVLHFLHYEECVWSKEAQTFQLSEPPLLPHQNNGHVIFRQSLFDGRIIISSSESAAAFAGYMEGAVLSAMEAVNKILNKKK
jgi:monoamine oxidase